MGRIIQRLGLLSMFLLILLSCGSKEKKKTIPTFKFSLEEDLETEKRIETCTVWKGNKERLAVAFAGGRLAVYSLPGLSLKKTIDTDVRMVRSMAFCKNGELLALVSLKGRLRFFAIDNGQEIVYPDLAGLRKVVCVASSPQSGLVAAGLADGRLVVLSSDLNSAIYKRTPYKIVRRILFKKKGRMLVCAGRRRGFSFFYGNFMRQGRSFYTESPVTSFAFSDNGRYLAVGTLFWKLNLYDLSKYRKVKELRFQFNPVSSVAFHPKQQWFFSGSGKVSPSKVRFFSYPALKIKRTIVRKKGEPLLLTFLKKQLLLAVHSNGDLLVYK